MLRRVESSSRYVRPVVCPAVVPDRLLLAVWRRALQVLRQYNEYLKEQMVKEAQDEAQYDEIRQKAEGRIWDQRDAQLKAQNDAREALMQQVSRHPHGCCCFISILRAEAVWTSPCFNSSCGDHRLTGAKSLANPSIGRIC